LKEKQSKAGGAKPSFFFFLFFSFASFLPSFLVLFVIFCVLGLLYLLLILRPGSSFWLERRLIAGNIVKEGGLLQIPLYGALRGFNMSKEALYRVGADDEAPTYSNIMGNIIVTVRNHSQGQELWEKIENLPKAAMLYNSLEILTFGNTILT
jgi:hypothetical protein